MIAHEQNVFKSNLANNFSEPTYFVVAITTAQFHSIMPELRFSAGSNPARGVLEIRDGEDFWQWSRLEIRLNVGQPYYKDNLSSSSLDNLVQIANSSSVQIKVILLEM